MFKDYTNVTDVKQLKEVEKQHNIMVLIGNGFDISVLNKYRDDGLVSSYENFYHYLYLRNKGVIRPDANVLFQRMTEEKEKAGENDKNWSDFEYLLQEMLKEIEKQNPQQREKSIAELEKALREIQSEFLKFLDDIVTPDIFDRLNRDAEDRQWATGFFSKFLGDVSEDDYLKMSFPDKVYHRELLNYLLVNFNYTSLFDNYVFLDKKQFEPRKNDKYSYNFEFYPNPAGYKYAKGTKDWKTGAGEKTVRYDWIETNIIHPHGYQNIPRSMLFGVENESYYDRKDKKDLNRFNKSYWAQCDQKYRSYFDDAELFIIYGMSMGETDKWWWKNIYRSMLEKDSELIIYNYCNEEPVDKEKVKQRFVDLCTDKKSTEEEIQKVKDKIFVVNYGKGLKAVKLFQLNDKAEEEGR